MVFKIHECFMIFSCVFFESNFHKEKIREELGKNLPERFNQNFYCIFGSIYEFIFGFLEIKENNFM